MATGFRNLTVYKKAFALAMDIYHVSKKFPKDELYSLTTQIRKSYKIKLPCLHIANCRLPTADWNRFISLPKQSFFYPISCFFLK